MRSTCAGPNHIIQIFSNPDPYFWKFSLNSQYSKFIHLDFKNKTSTIISYNPTEQKIVIPKILIADFPHLIDLNRKVDSIILFS